MTRTLIVLAVVTNLGCFDADPVSPREQIRPMSSTDRPSPRGIEEAKRYPGGWVYRIEGDYGPNDAVPPEAIVGAWKVDDDGTIVGDFTPNPNFKPVSER